MTQSALAGHIVEAIGGFIVGSPFGRLVDLQSVVVEPDRVRLRLPYRDEITTIANMVHGGAIASLIDVAATAACWSHPDVTLEARGSTVALTVHYLAPALGCDLIAEARVTKRGGSLCVCDVEVQSDQGEVVARALVTYRLAMPKRAAVPETKAAASAAPVPDDGGLEKDRVTCP